MRAWAKVAELTKAKTLSGGLVARCVPGPPFLLAEGTEVAFVPPQHDAPRYARVVSVRDEGRGTYFITFDCVKGIDDAERLAGCSCLVRRADLPTDALVVEPESLAGFEVYDEEAGFVGVVDEVIENPGQCLLSVVKPEGGEPVLIPLVDAFVKAFDEEASRIDLTLPDGLLEL